MTPLLCKTFLGTVVPVDAAGSSSPTRSSWPLSSGHDDERQVPEGREEDHSCDTRDWHGFCIGS